MKEVVIAFAGKPNVGKTALMNAIAGSSLQVGNWPGVTVEKKEAVFNRNGKRFRGVDIPGIYALTPYSMEEKVARDFLLEERPDIIVNVIDMTNVERNLSLTLQLMELGIPMVLALNMWDEFAHLGGDFNLGLFSKEIGLPSVKTVARTGEGVDDLISEVVKIADAPYVPKVPVYKHMTDIMVEEKVKAASEILEKCGLEGRYPLHWMSVKALEGDRETLERLKRCEIEDQFEPLREEIRKYHKQDVPDVFSDIREGYIKGLLRTCLKQSGKIRRQWTDLIDSVALHPFFGIPLFFLMMYLMFRFTFEGSGPFIDWTDSFLTSFVGRYIDAGLSAAGAAEWIRALVGDGIVGGVGAVLSFVPLMAFLYFFLGLLEESGYMARAAFVMDRVMRAVGLPGKAFVPLLIGFGCNVPAIYASRTLDSEKERKLTALLTPFMSCAARLPVYALFTAVFFKDSATGVIFGLYAGGIAVAMIIGLIYKKVFVRGEGTPLIMELPPYRIPTGKMIWNSIFIRTKSFVRKAGSLILVTMVILWVMMNLPYGTPVENTLLGRGARIITPAFKPNGFGKVEPVAALIPGIVAKEVVVGALGQMYHETEEGPVQEKEPLRPLQDMAREAVGLGRAALDSVKGVFGIRALSAFDLPEEEETGLSRRIGKDFTPLSALSYMVFILLFVPCVAVLAAVKHEFGWKMLFYVLLLTLIVPWLASFLVYQGGLLIGWGGA